MKIKTLLSIALLAAAGPSLASPDAVVAGVQLPAWVEHDGARAALEPGKVLQNGDQVFTGGGARLLVRTADGSFVKLGENGAIKFDNLGQNKGGKKLFTAALDVAKGAFRFTTQALARLRPREVDVKIATVTFGIRGTDVWGKADVDRDIVCLIEGRISVQRGNDVPFDMHDPLSFYIAPKNAPPLPIAPVPPEQLKKWSAETNIAPGKGAVRAGGKWKLILLTAAAQEDALAAYDQLNAAGYPARIVPLKKDNAQVYQVRIAGLPTKGDAEALAQQLKGTMNITEPRVSD